MAITECVCISRTRSACVCARVCTHACTHICPHGIASVFGTGFLVAKKCHCMSLHLSGIVYESCIVAKLIGSEVSQTGRGANPDSATYWRGNLGQSAEPLCFSVSSFAKHKSLSFLWLIT